MADYDLIVLGGGSAGLTAAGTAAQLGARTLLVERHKLGGECLNTGCVPSKALIRSANVAALVARAGEFGMDGARPQVNFTKVMERVAGGDPQGGAARQPGKAGPLRGRNALRRGPVPLLPAKLLLNGETLRSKKFVLATGSRPLVPPLDGLTDYLTNETLFEIRTQPRHLLIMGAGPIGVEMAQAFRRLGSEVTLIDMAPRILPHEDEEVSAEVAAFLKREGIRVYVDAAVKADSVRQTNNGLKHTLTLDHHGTPETVSGDTLLVAVGRRPNVEELGLDKAGVAVERQGIRVDSRCRTTARNIYACGDVTGHFLFTHTAEYQGKVAVTNAILHVPMKLNYKAVPWAIFSDPEVARVGLTESEAREKHGSVKVHRVSFRSEDRAITDSERVGMVKLIATRWRGKLLGAHIVGPHAGELIMEYTLAMKHGISLAGLSNTIHPYPTFSLAGRHAADFYWMEKSTEGLVRWIQRIFGYSGPIAERYKGEQDEEE